MLWSSIEHKYKITGNDKYLKIVQILYFNKCKCYSRSEKPETVQANRPLL